MQRLFIGLTALGLAFSLLSIVQDRATAQDFYSICNARTCQRPDGEQTCTDHFPAAGSDQTFYNPGWVCGYSVFEWDVCDDNLYEWCRILKDWSDYGCSGVVQVTSTEYTHRCSD